MNYREYLYSQSVRLGLDAAVIDERARRFARTSPVSTSDAYYWFSAFLGLTDSPETAEELLGMVEDTPPEAARSGITADYALGMLLAGLRPIADRQVRKIVDNAQS